MLTSSNANLSNSTQKIVPLQPFIKENTGIIGHYFCKKITEFIGQVKN